MQTLQIALMGLNVLVLPALVGVARWLIKVELRLARMEWAMNAKGGANAP